jgi:hypothetical protein
VDVGARKSEFMKPLAKHFPGADVFSFEPNLKFQPIGKRFRMPVGLDYPLPVCGFSPRVLKIDCDENTLEVLANTPLQHFDAVVIEVTEDTPDYWPIRNNRATIEAAMLVAGFKNSHAVDVVICHASGQIAQTDVLYWR